MHIKAMVVCHPVVRDPPLPFYLALSLFSLNLSHRFQSCVPLFGSHTGSADETIASGFMMRIKGGKQNVHRYLQHHIFFPV
jgi:hypothetical protein